MTTASRDAAEMSNQTRTQIAASGSGCSALPELVRELMARYDAYRAMWVEEFGNADNFDAWFTSKALSPSSPSGANR